jgi:N-dimethylarginine dimethylaminohydrolase
VDNLAISIGAGASVLLSIHELTAFQLTWVHTFVKIANPSAPRFLMCRPLHFAVTYSINPWMDPRAWADRSETLRATAGHQWDGLRRTLLGNGAVIETIEPEVGLPDLVFTANAAVVLDRKAVLARFFHPERQREQPFLTAGFRALQSQGLLNEVVEMPDGVVLEGAGDCIWDRSRGLFWMGSGFRSDVDAKYVIADVFGVQCLSLELSDPCFYHLDTALCALPNGDVLYYPRAFTDAALAIIHEHVSSEQRIPLGHSDAHRFAANAVCFNADGIGDVLVLSSCSAPLRNMLKERGYTVVKTPLQSFLRSGGSACCLTLRLDYRNVAEQAEAMDAA